MDSCSRLRPVASVSGSVKTLTPLVWPGMDPMIPTVPAARITQP